jgi:hypothetical protein
MARASLVLLLLLLLAGTATLATVAARPGVTIPIAPAAAHDPAKAAPVRFGSACADIVNRSNRLLRPPRRLDDIIRGVGPCIVF